MKRLILSGTVYPIFKVDGKFQKTTTSQPSNVSPSFPDSPRGVMAQSPPPRWWAALQDAGGTLPALSTRHPRFGGVDGAEDGFVSHDRPIFFFRFFFGLGKEGEEIVRVFYGECFCKNCFFFFGVVFTNHLMNVLYLVFLWPCHGDIHFVEMASAFGLVWTPSFALSPTAPN